MERRQLSGLDVKVSGILLKNLLDLVAKKFPQFTVSTMNSAEMAEQFGEQFRDNVAVTQGGLIAINTDYATIDSPMHEFGHIHLAIMKQNNPALYETIINLALQDTSTAAQAIKEKYSDQSLAEIGEEIFVYHLGLYSTNQLQLQYPSQAKKTWLQRLIAAIKEFFTGMKQNLSVKKLNVETASLQDMIEAIGTDMLSDGLKHNLSNIDLSHIKERRNLNTVSTIDNELNKLLISERKSNTSYSDFQRSIEGLKKYISFDFRAYKDNEKAFENIPNKQAMIQIGAMLKEDWVRGYSNIYTLNEFAKATTITAMHDHNHSVTKPILNLTTDNKNIIVVTQIINGKVDCKLFDLNNSKSTTNEESSRNIGSLFTKNELEAKRMGITLDGTRTNLNSLRMGLIAIEANTKSKKLLFNNLTTIDTTRETVTRSGITIDEAVANLQGLAKLDKFDMSQEIKDKVNAINLSKFNLRTNYIEFYRSMLSYYTKQDINMGAKNDLVEHTYLAKLFNLNAQSADEQSDLIIECSNASII